MGSILSTNGPSGKPGAVQFLLINAGLSCFVLVAHGGALLLVLSGRVPAPPGYAEMVRTIAPITLPIAGLMLLGSAIGSVVPTARSLVLVFQAVVLGLASLAILVWAGSLVLNGIPAGNFAWTPGFLTAWLTYSAFLCGRFAMPGEWRQYAAVRYVAAVAAAVTLPVDVGVFLRFLLQMSRMR
jgi:hypothetical protein